MNAWPFVFRYFPNDRCWWLIHTVFPIEGDVPCKPDHEWGAVEGEDIERLER